MDNSVLDSLMDSLLDRPMDSRLTIPLDLLAVVGFVNVDGFAVVEMTTTHMIMITTTNHQGPLNKGVGDSLSNSLVFILLYVHFHLIYIVSTIT
jgi:hypothetical protein